MNTPTGGPWQSRSEYEPWLIIGNVDGEIHADGTTSYTYKSICEICDDDGDARDNEANRRLIIAAPDLLKALRKIADTPAWGAPDKWETTPADVRIFARDAIRKATGA